MGNFDRHFGVAWVQHLDGPLRRDLFAEAILCFEHRAINTHPQIDLPLRFALRVRGKTVLGQHFAQWPLVRIR